MRCRTVSQWSISVYMYAGMYACMYAYMSAVELPCLYFVRSTISNTCTVLLYNYDRFEDLTKSPFKGISGVASDLNESNLRSVGG